jgi:hypothetical protein
MEKTKQEAFMVITAAWKVSTVRGTPKGRRRLSKAGGVGVKAKSNDCLKEGAGHFQGSLMGKPR